MVIWCYKLTHFLLKNAFICVGNIHLSLVVVEIKWQRLLFATHFGYGFTDGTLYF